MSPGPRRPPTGASTRSCAEQSRLVRVGDTRAPCPPPGPCLPLRRGVAGPAPRPSSQSRRDQRPGPSPIGGSFRPREPHSGIGPASVGAGYRGCGGESKSGTDHSRGEPLERHSARGDRPRKGPRTCLGALESVRRNDLGVPRATPRCLPGSAGSRRKRWERVGLGPASRCVRRPGSWERPVTPASWTRTRGSRTPRCGPSRGIGARCSSRHSIGWCRAPR